MKHLKPIYLLLFVVLAFAPVVQGQTRIAGVDTQRLIFESAAGMAAAEQFSLFAEGLQNEITALESELQQKTQEYETQQRALSEEALSQKAREIENLNRQITRAREDAEADLSAREQQLIEPVVILANEQMKAYGDAQGYDLILDIASGVFAFLNPRADVTTAVLGRMDDAFRAPSGGAAPAGDGSPPDSAVGETTEESELVPPATQP